MLLFKICFLGSLLLVCNAESLTKDKKEPSPVILEENAFETAHKIHRPNEEFHTSHKITGLPKAQYLKIDNEDEDTDTASSLMQLQETQNLLSTKERPELNPILSALINEDVMKSIEAKRAIEQEQQDAVSTEAAGTEGPLFVLTTAKPKPKEDLSLDDDINVGLIDQPISLDAAGSENNQKSRIQIKKGPNGMDYEYEYVYYYYDDDEAAGKKQQEAESTVVDESSKKGIQPQERGKSRYTNIERSTTSAPNNVLVSGKAKGRANIPEASEDVDEGRLPVMTRFPSRGKNVDASSETLENTASASNEKSKKISVRRPSLELVDSETFNTDEKQAKGSPRNGDSEKPAPTAVNETTKSEEAVVEEGKPDEKEEESPIAEEIDQTTPLMEKAALDLYAILANENLEMDMTTDLDEDLTTDLPDTTESVEDVMTTIDEEAETVIPTTPSTTTTTTTTTTEAPTTASTTTTTTTTTTAAPSLFGAGRRGLATAGRNRFRLKSGATAAATTSTTESTPAAAAEPESTGGLKGRNRFQRPSFGNRNRAATTASTPATAEEEVVVKEEDKPVAASPPLRGRTRNRFNIRGQVSTTTTTTTESIQGQEQNDEENQVSSTTARSLRGRPTLNIRGRSRLGSRTTAATQAPVNEEEESAAVPAVSTEGAEEKPASSSLPTRPSRFNLNRVGAGGAPGANRLLPRARLNTLRTTSTTQATVESADESSNDVKEQSDDENAAAAKSESETTPAAAVGGLNRLKTRPRLQLQTKTDSRPKSSPIPVRKVNPLLARRKLALGPSTTESAAAAEEPSEDSAEPASSDDSEKKDADTAQTTEDATPEDGTDVPETTTKQARGLGLLAQRRRLPIRKPGTLL